MKHAYRSWFAAGLLAVFAIGGVAAPAGAEAPAVAAESGFDAQRLQRLDRYVERAVNGGELPGVVGSIYRDGKPVHRIVTGWRDVASETPMSEDAIFRIYSMTKPVTAVAAMLLVEEGLLHLNEPLGKYVPALKALTVYAGGEGDDMETVALQRPLTLHHLFTHTAGFTYNFMGDEPVHGLYLEHGIFPGIIGESGLFTGGGGQPVESMEELVEVLADIPLLHQPGERFSYGISTDILGYIVEQVSGQPLDRFMHERLFAPLGMVDTAFVVPDNKLERFTTNYAWGEDGLKPVDTPQSSPYRDAGRLWSGGAGLVSTAEDYQRFLQMLLNRGVLDGVRILGPHTVDFMLQNHLPYPAAANSDPGEGFGLGFGIVEDPARTGTLRAAGEAFWGGAASTMFWIDPEHRVSAVFMTQVIPPRDEDWRRKVRNLVYQALQ